LKCLTIDTTTKATALALAEICRTDEGTCRTDQETCRTDQETYAAQETRHADEETCPTDRAGEETAIHVIGEGFLHDHQTHSERLIPFLEALLSAAGWTLEDLDGIIAVRGPGSFTGIRIGLATAQGLAKALHLPLWSVLSLDCLSWATSHIVWGGEESPVTAVALDARKNEWYAACYVWSSPENRLCSIAPCAAAPENFLRQLQELSQDHAHEYPRTVIFAGDALLRKETRQLIRDHLGKRAMILPPEQALPRGSYVVREFVYAQQREKHLETAPYYIRLSEAETQYLLKQEQRAKQQERQNHATS